MSRNVAEPVDDLGDLEGPPDPDDGFLLDLFSLSAGSGTKNVDIDNRLS